MILPEVNGFSESHRVYAGQSSRDRDFGYKRGCWSNNRTANLSETVRKTVRDTVSEIRLLSKLLILLVGAQGLEPWTR
jgi:hypothetical protein